ncbi:MAG TPA: hypothetical protein VHB21_28575, partial [Minicystis sp.]|nr:hypothetical protein [Minicystis sp.]
MKHVSLLCLVGLLGCSGAAGLGAGRTEAAEKWYQRANAAFAVADVEEAHDSVNRALATSPNDPETRLLAAKIALARLDFAETLRLLKGLKCDDAGDERCKKLGTEAASLRGRAYWYKGDLEPAADELEAMLNDPEVKDEWAKSVSKLARQGQGRTPFTLSGALVAQAEIVHVAPEAPYFVIQIEIDGEPALAMVHTANAEVVLDSSTRQEPSWVSLRIGDRLEVKDVPAVTQDLSGLGKELGAPVKALLGVNLLRHLNATIDYDGHQFVARSFTPPPPPDATRVPLYYFRGGGMVVKSGFGGDKGPSAALLVNTGAWYPLALDTAGWKKAGIDLASLKPIPQAPGVKEGVVPMLRVGAFDVPQVPAVFGDQMNHDIEAIEKQLTPAALDGVMGAGLLSHFRCTFGDGGRLLWIEDNTAMQRVLNQGQLAPRGAPA